MSSCSLFESSAPNVPGLGDTKEGVEGIVGQVNPIWFTGSSEISLYDRSGEPASHMYYDVDPALDFENNTVQFVVATPQSSPIEYGIDYTSGQHFTSKFYCSEEDIWKKSSSLIDRPPFSIGHVPRYLDQLSTPLKIYVFGGENEYMNSFRRSSFGARIVGSFIEQECPQKSCSTPGDWKSRVILIGISLSDPDWNQVTKMKEVYDRVDWDYVQAFIENGQGVNIFGGVYYPGFRLGAEISISKAMRFLQDSGTYLEKKRLFQMRKSCLNLYRYIDQNVYEMAPSLKKYFSLDSKDKQRAFYAKGYIKRQDYFYYRFTQYFRKFAGQFLTCRDYIYPSNINSDPIKHHFMVYLSAVHLLYELGFQFNCRQNQWERRYTDYSKGSTLYPKAFLFCNEETMDNAFETAPLLLDKLADENKYSYRYIDYDSSVFGTHNKIYGWVKKSNKTQRCERSEKQNYLEKRHSFPNEVKWRKRRLNIDSNLGVIQ